MVMVWGPTFKQVKVVRGDVGCFGREDVVMQPAAQAQVVGKAAEESHGTVVMTIYQAGHH